MPLKRLWRDNVPIDATRTTEVGAERIRELLRSTPTPLVIAVMHGPLVWITGDARFTAWKDDILPRLGQPGAERIELNGFPDGRCYVASEWVNTDGVVAVLFEELH